MRFNVSELEMQERSRIASEKNLNEASYQPGRPTIPAGMDGIISKSMWHFISEDGQTIAVETAPNKFDVYVNGKLDRTENATKQEVVDKIRPRDF